jgi:CHAT domain-containing protein
MTPSIKTLILLVGIGMLLITVSAQRTSSQSHRKWYQHALDLYNRDEPDAETDSIAYALFLKTADATTTLEKELASDCLIKAGNIQQGQSKFEQANLHYHQALGLVNQYKLEEQLRFEALLYLGSSHYFNNIIDSAQFYFENASAVADSYHGKKRLPELDRLYNSLGAIYFESANYTQAKNYFERALDLSTPGSEDYADMYIGIQSNIASCLVKLNQYEEALNILVALKPAEHQKNLIRQNTAHCYFRLGNLDAALEIYSTLVPTENYSGVIAIADMGRVYMKKGEWKKAEAAFDSAIRKNNRIAPDIRNKEGANAYLYRSELAAMQGLDEEAMSWINAAISAASFSNAENQNDFPNADVSLSVSPVTLFSILHFKAGLLWKRYTSLNDKTALLQAVETYKQAIETADYIKLNFDNDEARLFFTDNNKTIYTEALEAAYEAATFNSETINDILYVFENYKGRILQQQLENNQIRNKDDVVDSVYKKEQALKQLIAFYLSRINQTNNTTEVQNLLQKKRSVEIELSRLQKRKPKSVYTQAFLSGETNNIKLIEAIQDQLPVNTTVVHFFEVSDSVLFCLWINKDNHKINRIVTNRQFQNNLDHLNAQLYGQMEGERYAGHEAAASIYKNLISATDLDDDKNEHWVIIPDGKLYRLPFEALENGGDGKDYLIRTKEVSYHFSISLLLQKTDIADPVHSEMILGFTPFDHLDDHIRKSRLSVLPESAQEIDSTKALLIRGSEANKKRFLDEYASYPTIHLATHASADTASNMHWIQFYPSGDDVINNRIYLPEIYQLNMNNAALVILSACESGTGPQAAGEGLISLSRAFLYAGTRGVISTLWKSEDKVSAYLMQKLHQYIREGLTVTKALQKAKQDLLADKTMDERFKQPSYWANFIYFGRIHADEKNESAMSRMAWILLGVGSVLIGLKILAQSRRLSRNKSQELTRS